MSNITVTVEKENEEHELKKGCIRLIEVGGQIAHTLTLRAGDINVQHCNLVIEVKKMVDTINPMDDGTCRTLKNQYHQTSVQNFESQGSFGASGVVNCEKVIAIDEQNMKLRLDTIGTLTTDGNSPKHNNRVAECKQIKIRQATEQGYTLCNIGGAADLNYPSSHTRRGRVIENGEICPTIATENIPNVIELGNPKFYNFLYLIDEEWWLIRIRKLTPKECWRLMGFSDEDFEKAEKVCSNTQLYKQAGNSIVVNCLEAIFKQLIGEAV